MTSCSVLFCCLQGDVTGAGRDVRRHCPSPYDEISNSFPRTQDLFSTADAKAGDLCILDFVEDNELDSCDGEEGQVGADAAPLHWGQPVASVLIRYRCEQTWHCDIKEFHSQHVSSSSYCINMPLMLHSDTGLFSPVTKGSDKHTMMWNSLSFSSITCGAQSGPL